MRLPCVAQSKITPPCLSARDVPCLEGHCWVAKLVQYIRAQNIACCWTAINSRIAFGQLFNPERSPLVRPTGGSHIVVSHWCWCRCWYWCWWRHCQWAERWKIQSIPSDRTLEIVEASLRVANQRDLDALTALVLTSSFQQADGNWIHIKTSGRRSSTAFC